MMNTHAPQFTPLPFTLHKVRVGQNPHWVLLLFLQLLRRYSPTFCLVIETQSKKNLSNGGTIFIQTSLTKGENNQVFDAVYKPVQQISFLLWLPGQEVRRNIPNRDINVKKILRHFNQKKHFQMFLFDSSINHERFCLKLFTLQRVRNMGIAAHFPDIHRNVLPFSRRVAVPLIVNGTFMYLLKKN